jgi:hypothetical protein
MNPQFNVSLVTRKALGELDKTSTPPERLVAVGRGISSLDRITGWTGLWESESIQLITA